MYPHQKKKIELRKKQPKKEFKWSKEKLGYKTDRFGRDYILKKHDKRMFKTHHCRYCTRPLKDDGTKCCSREDYDLLKVERCWKCNIEFKGEYPEERIERHIHRGNTCLKCELDFNRSFLKKKKLGLLDIDKSRGKELLNQFFGKD